MTEPSSAAGIAAEHGARVVARLPGGPVSDSWLLEAQGRRMALRMDRPAARALALDRAAEREVLDCVAAAGIGPAVIWADPERGLLLTSWVEGTPWTPEQMRDPERLATLAGLLRRLHALPPRGPRFRPDEAAARYALLAGSREATELAGRALALSRELLADGPRALCHNDLVHHNIIAGDPLRLIDWEYAAVGDPLFDLAAVLRHHQLPDAAADRFLACYAGGAARVPVERLDRFCLLYDLLAALWYLAMAQVGGRPGEGDGGLTGALARIGARRP